MGSRRKVRAEFKHSIGTKIFVAFIAMGVMIGVLGTYGYWVLASAGKMVTGTYDGPLMAINYARASSVDFVQMKEAALERRYLPRANRKAIDQHIDDLSSTFFEDLGVAEERLGSDDERAVAEKIRGLVTQWQDKWSKSKASDTESDFGTLDQKILDQFDTLIELNADHSFVGRRKAVWAISDFKYAMLGVTILALLFSFGITIYLSRRIMKPLSAAVSAANRIAAGEFEAEIPLASSDETGVLLRSMTVMQDNIRSMVERETARAESAEARLAHALETSGEGVLLVAADGKILLANKTMRDFFPNVTEALVAGADFTEVSRQAQQNIVGEIGLPSAQDLGIGRHARLLGTAERQLKDGRWIRSTGSRTNEGGLIFFVSDYTAVKEREENFRRAQQAAEAASAAKSRFLANMSHELRTPLNAIIGFSEILSSEMFGALGNPRYTSYASDIHRSGCHLLDVINSVLEISKSDAGKQSLRSESVDLGAILRECSSMLQQQFAAADLRYSWEIPQSPVHVMGEGPKLRQILLNVLSNAMKFTNSGGGVTAILKEDQRDVIAEIVDTGIGMSPEDIETALTPFGQVDNRLERKYEGTGLGLPLAKSMVELHRGSLEFESARGKGTTVRIRLPKRHPMASERPLAMAS